MLFRPVPDRPDGPPTERDRKQIELFCRFLDGERSHEIVAWACDDPMSSANDPEMVGMGC